MSNKKLIIKDKRGTDLGPQHIKQERLYTELKNLSKCVFLKIPLFFKVYFFSL